MSVLLPAKDAAGTIGAAVRSTLRAMPRDAELLVVDDGSIDGTGRVLDGFSDARLRVLRHDAPRGVAAALNAALATTDSAIVARMDADDLTLPWRFRAQLPALASADLVFGSMLLIDARGRPVGASNPSPVHPVAAHLQLLLENPFAHPTLVGRREALTGPGGYRATPVEDYDLWLRAAAAGFSMRKLRVPVLAYRRHAGQATQSWSRATPDPLLDESYAAMLPAELRGHASGLRERAVFRLRDPADAAWEALVDLIRSSSESLPSADRRRVLRRIPQDAATERFIGSASSSRDSPR